MKFNNWTVTINGKGSYNVVRDEDTLVILENYQHVALYLKLENGSIKVKSLSYGNDVSLNVDTREIIVNVINLLDDDD